MKDFAGRTAFVTGGAHGVGIGLVRALLAQGCNVAIADIRPFNRERIFEGEGNAARKGLNKVYGAEEAKKIKQYGLADRP